MEHEDFCTGYCRVLDQSRMVAVVTEDGKLLEADCCYPDCSHAMNCDIARRICALTDSQ